jgi:hypothetical protein
MSGGLCTCSHIRTFLDYENRNARDLLLDCLSQWVYNDEDNSPEMTAVSEYLLGTASRSALDHTLWSIEYQGSL